METKPNGLGGGKAQKIESPVPGCLGRMVNLFDLGTAVNGNNLLTDKPHHDGSSLSRSRSTVTRMPHSSNKRQLEAELTMSDLRRSASSKVSGTPMKKLIAREMSKDVEQHKQSPPTNVVAKLMGLETLPETATQRSKSRRSYSHSSLNLPATSIDNELSRELYEMWQSPQKASSPRKGRYDESMALVRQKFAEAKRLVTDENFHHSQEFQDALQVLSSNKDLFVKYLQESSSFANQAPPCPETKRITVLRPSKAVETEKFVHQGRKNNNKHGKKSASSSQETGFGNRVQPTRIVVLKPSLVKSLDTKAVTSSPSSPRYFDDESNEVAKEITRQVRENLMGHRRNETQSSSVLSNGYIGDDSSDNEDPVGNLSDSDVMSPASKHSWEFPKGYESPFSPSSFSRGSFSPESSVCREAKKRLSERWALMSVTRSSKPHKQIPRDSSTLGEMLALSETKTSNEAAPETRVSTSCITSDLSRVDILARSKSVPDGRLNGELTETRSLKSSWKVSNLFFKNKKATKESKNMSQVTTTSSVALPEKSSQDSLFPRDSLPPVEELTTPKPLVAGNTNENQDQPSPVSVLFPPFQEESVGVPECSQGEELSLKSNLIDKSPPIGSIARILSWDDDSCANNISKPTMGVHEGEDWHLYVETLLTAGGFSNGCTVSLMSRWHLPNSPLDPSLIDKYANPEGKHKQERSTRKLIFDVINSVIVETTTACTGGDGTQPFDLVEHVWAQLKDWVLDEPSELDSREDMDAESLVKEEIVGKAWSRILRCEVDEFGIEIESTLLQNLVEEAVMDLTR